MSNALNNAGGCGGEGLRVLDLFSAAAGGWSLGLHRAGYRTMAACEVIEWRRAIYGQNNPGVRIYDDVCTLDANRLLGDFGYLPDIIVGSPPCQDISPANTKGKGVDGERSSLYFEAIRIIGECRPRWFALENSANLRTRGADRVIRALAEVGYTCWAFVVRAEDIGANHTRPRSWLIGCDLSQVADTDGIGRDDRWSRGWSRLHLSDAHDPFDTASQRHESGRSWGCRANGFGSPSAPEGDTERNTPHPDQARQARQAHGCVVAGIRQAEIAHDGCCDGRVDDGSCERQMGLRSPDSDGSDRPRSIWSLASLADRIRMDDGLPSRVAGTRIAVGGPRGTSAASMIVEAYGDAVCPQIPEAIGKAILRTEAALSAVLAA